jgi:hypothetical protein
VEAQNGAVVADLHHYYEEQDLDPQQCGKSDPDPYQSEKSYSDAHQSENRDPGPDQPLSDADPEHWLVCQLSIALA